MNTTSVNFNVSAHAHKVIGVFAYRTKIEIICDTDSCIIAGSEQKMKNYLVAQGSPINEITIRPTRFGEIMRGLQLGAPYSFDEESYNRFFPSAAKYGWALGPEDFSPNPERGIHLVRVQFFSS